MEISKITAPSEWVYFAKGSANILFKYTGDNDYLRHKLLRVRLLKEEDEYISTCELYDFIELKCKHLFPKHIIDIQLVVLTTDFVNQLDNHGNKLMLKERYGLLIPNILNSNYSRQALSKNCNLYSSIDNNDPDQVDSVIFEIKPKWLYDNTTTLYCRTCSLNQLRGNERHYCPLDLLFDEAIDQGIDDLFLPIPTKLLDKIEVKNKIPLKKLFKNYLKDPNNVFQKLKQYQRINNQNDLIKNLTSENDVSQNLSLVMTLRDVGLFIKWEKYDISNNIHTSHNNINNIIRIDGYGKFLLTCNIYDLDLKSKLKYKYWLNIEQQLQPIYNSFNPNWRGCVRSIVDNNVSEGL